VAQDKATRRARFLEALGQTEDPEEVKKAERRERLQAALAEAEQEPEGGVIQRSGEALAAAISHVLSELPGQIGEFMASKDPGEFRIDPGQPLNALGSPAISLEPGSKLPVSYPPTPFRSAIFETLNDFQLRLDSAADAVSSGYPGGFAPQDIAPRFAPVVNELLVRGATEAGQFIANPERLIREKGRGAAVGALAEFVTGGVLMDIGDLVRASTRGVAHLTAKGAVEKMDEADALRRYADTEGPAPQIRDVDTGPDLYVDLPSDRPLNVSGVIGVKKVDAGEYHKRATLRLIFEEKDVTAAEVAQLIGRDDLTIKQLGTSHAPNQGTRFTVAAKDNETLESLMQKFGGENRLSDEVGAVRIGQEIPSETALVRQVPDPEPIVTVSGPRGGMSIEDSRRVDELLDQRDGLPTRGPAEQTPGPVAQARLDLGLEGSLPGPRGLDSRVTVAGRRLDEADAAAGQGTIGELGEIQGRAQSGAVARKFDELARGNVPGDVRTPAPPPVEAVVPQPHPLDIKTREVLSSIRRELLDLNKKLGEDYQGHAFRQATKRIVRHLNNRRAQDGLHPTTLEDLMDLPPLPPDPDVRRAFLDMGDDVSQADRDLVAEAYRLAHEAPDSAPAFHIVRDNPEDLILRQVRGDIPPPISAVSIGDAQIAAQTVESLRARIIRLSLQYDDEYLGRVNWAIHGKVTLPTEVGDLRRLATFIDSVRAGQSRMPMTPRDVKALRKLWRNPDVAKEVTPPSSGMRIAPEKPPKDADLLVHESMPSSVDVLDKGINWFSRLVRDFDKIVPQISKRTDPILKAKRARLISLDKKWRVLVKGMKQGDTIDTQVSEILGGKHGDVFELEARVRTSDVLNRRSIDIAAEARRDLDELFAELKITMPDLNYNKAYITWIRDAYAGELPPSLIRGMGARKWFRFGRRSGAPEPENLSFMESFSVYAHAAVHKIHMDQVTEIFDEVEAGLRIQFQQAKNLADELASNPGVGKITRMKTRNRSLRLSNQVEVIVSKRNKLLGRSSTAERFVDNVIISAANMADIAIKPRPTSRLSLNISTGLYRGILGNNVSAALNNFTQSLNTLATHPVHSLRGIARFATPKGFKQVMDAGLTEDLVDLMLESRALSFGAMRKPRKVLKVASAGHFRTWDDVIFAPFNFAEFLNRGLAFHVGISKGLREGLDMPAAMRMGRELSDETQFLYNEISRNPLFQGVLTRPLFGVLTSYPVKQAEFLARLAKKDPAGIIRYVVMAGVADKILTDMDIEIDAITNNLKDRTGISGALTGALGGSSEEMDTFLRGIGIDPGEPMEIPGTAFIRTLEGAALGRFLEITPGGQLVSSAYRVLSGAFGGTPTSFWRETVEMLDAVSNIAPAAVSNKRIIRSMTDAARGKRESLLVGPASIQAIQPDGSLKTVYQPEEAFRSLPFIRQSPLGRRGNVQSPTTPLQELGRNVGIRPGGISQRGHSDFVLESRQLVADLRAQRTGTMDAAADVISRGDLEGGERLLRMVGATGSGFRQSVRSGKLDPTLRFFEGLSKLERAVLVAEYGFDKLQSEILAAKKRQAKLR
jgi:hypothetical protein